ncbi:uncharacterized protein LOC143188787 [Calliopsis andreniformis]|uniref:uncharacterized protein LOC143188787 n=1 Tax=Calliopsis andreniformis TaxID=337506 RepID=UPI003FCEB1EE
MLRACELLPATICMACLIFCCSACSPDIGQPLDLDQFSGTWYFIAGTPVDTSLSRCGQFTVRRTSGNAFVIKYTAYSYRNDMPVTFNVDGSVRENRVIGTWQLQGSKRKLGPFHHAIVFANYNTALGMVVCPESTATHHQRYKFSMIWSRERSLPSPILMELKSKLGVYINQEEIRVVDHRNC